MRGEREAQGRRERSDARAPAALDATSHRTSHRLTWSNRATLQYTGTIDKSSKTGTPGKQFDSSRTRGTTFDFQLGQGRVIKGWDQGLEGLCVGAKATLTIPPELGYGATGAGGDIPGGATLSFDVEVMGHSEGPPEQNLFKELDTDEDTKLTKEEILAFFKKQGKDELPEGLWDSEDKNKDGASRT